MRELMEEKGITEQVPFRVKRKAAAELCLQDQGEAGRSTALRLLVLHP